jgi:hypothetical protein
MHDRKLLNDDARDDCAMHRARRHVCRALARHHKHDGGLNRRKVTEYGTTAGAAIETAFSPNDTSAMTEKKLPYP